MSERPSCEAPAATFCADAAEPGLEIDGDAGLFVPAHLLRIEIRRVVAARDPVEREGELLRRGGSGGEDDGGERKRQSRGELHEFLHKAQGIESLYLDARRRSVVTTRLPGR